MCGINFNKPKRLQFNDHIGSIAGKGEIKDDQNESLLISCHQSSCR